MTTTTTQLEHIAEGKANIQVFDLDKAFWENYAKGRPQPPPSFFQRIFDYHASQNGTFGTLHDVGAGDSPYARRLKQHFDHVIISDVSKGNVDLAQARLGTNGFSYRTAKVEEADDIAPSSVDMVFATNMMHWADQEAAMEAIAKQLKPGGTFACAGFGAARFEDPSVEDVWKRLNWQGGRTLIRQSDDPEQTIAIMSRSQGRYNVAPLREDWFLPGAKRIHLNLHMGGVAEMVPPEEAHRIREPDRCGAQDVETFERDEGWFFEADWQGVKEHMESFPYLNLEDDESARLKVELESLVRSRGTVRGHWPANIILATRR